ncbi:hypothetical protein [Aquisalimonas asiatica]|uniref:Uncharacterized protein n=1 Tax=Aquisalimonas asiatica TaxID=406100 RepID=A0A1H8UIK0_9GAMM|nr:hypothetical protein [Aquisalimonas asiatica]SEP03052.1 hypothetical protein SAMN04488052_1076 [Aquisalimonas asiatica]
MEQVRMDAGASKSPVGDVERELATGLAQLVHSKKQFAEEFGLPLRQVFAECPELLDVTSPEETFHHWLVTCPDGAERLRAFLRLLARDHAAMVMALDDASEAVVHGRLPAAAGRWSVGRRLKSRWRGLLAWLRRPAKARQMLEVAVPAFTWSYLRHRPAAATLATAPPCTSQPGPATPNTSHTDGARQS